MPLSFMREYFVLPSPELFVFPPQDLPAVLPPASLGTHGFRPPFNIPPSLFSAALDVKIPVTATCVYLAAAVALNSFNRLNNGKEWSLSKGRSFHWFVISHNISIAIYSAWTFCGMVATLQRALNVQSLSGYLDSICHIHGTSGLGYGLSYNSTTSSWFAESSPTISSEPWDSMNHGRIWGAGLGFYGWLFYLSKLWEFVDTAIILAKGKQASLLQAYHHAGAFLCMWAGVRYMSPPFWTSILFNSFVHTLMYTYYGLVAMRVSLPRHLKQSLTSLQIVQIISGIIFFVAQLFTSYNIPTKDLRSHLDEEGMATGAYHTTPCIVTSGQAFAIWLSVLYLTPLMVLFFQFFAQTYLQTRRQSSKVVNKGRQSK